jgi:hypothetical protein
MSKITLTATESLVIDKARWYKRPQRVFGRGNRTTDLMRNGDTITFNDQQQLLRALAGQLTSKEQFGTVMEV